jgi:phosphate transport system protein
MDNYERHISQGFNSDLKALTLQLTYLGGLVEQQVGESVDALLSMNADLARQVQEREDDVDELDIVLNESCTRILALRQPAASDLRRVIAISKCVSDLERIGDEANKIARLAVQLIEAGASPRGYAEVKSIGQQVNIMLHDVLHAFVRQDAKQAIAVIFQDENVDKEYHAAMQSLTVFMMEEKSPNQMSVLWALRALERIGDHVCNIAEQVLYLTTGRDFRHASKEEMEGLLSDNQGL